LLKAPELQRLSVTVEVLRVGVMIVGVMTVGVLSVGVMTVGILSVGVMTLSRNLLDTTLCDKVCQWLATVGLFSPSTPVSSTNKTDRHDITEILLKVALNTLPLTFTSYRIFTSKEWKTMQYNKSRKYKYVSNKGEFDAIDPATTDYVLGIYI
jgi:hypothetical protein